jgi:hypothetical protein
MITGYERKYQQTNYLNSYFTKPESLQKEKNNKWLIGWEQNYEHSWELLQ